MKVAVIGCGSIGKRHIANLRMLGVRDVVICDTGGKALEDTSRAFRIPKRYVDYRRAIAENGDCAAAFVCSPTSLHVAQAQFLAEHKIDIFMEKPLSHTMAGVDRLRQTIARNKVLLMMGMCYRFHPGLLIIKSLVARKACGRVYSARAYGGHYLPDWHPKEDYRNVPYAKRSSGGGVILTSIHGYDYIRWLFGDVCEVWGRAEKVSVLRIDVEDVALAIFKTKTGILVSSYTDFLERQREHRIDIVCERGCIHWDYNVNEVRVFDGTARRWKVMKYAFKADDMYVREVRHFLRCVKKGTADRSLDVNDGAKTLMLALAVKRSGKSKRIVYL